MSSSNKNNTFLCFRWLKVGCVVVRICMSLCKDFLLEEILVSSLFVLIACAYYSKMFYSSSAIPFPFRRKGHFSRERPDIRQSASAHMTTGLIPHIFILLDHYRTRPEHIISQLHMYIYKYTYINI